MGLVSQYDGLLVRRLRVVRRTSGPSISAALSINTDRPCGNLKSPRRENVSS
jgi:hypothetical protein